MTITKKVLDNTFDLFEEIIKDRKLYLYSEFQGFSESNKIREKSLERINNYLSKKELRPAEKLYLENLKQEYLKFKQRPGLDSKLHELGFDEFLLGKICNFLNKKHNTKSITPKNVNFSYLNDINQKELLETQGIGLKTVHEINKVLERYGVKLNG